MTPASGRAARARVCRLTGYRRTAYGLTRAVAVAAALAAPRPATAQMEHPPAAAGHDERFRPQYHFTPPANWMNDPNGLVYADGEWHLFYQHNPFGISWGHMSWGHATSPDLVHWRHLPVAIPESAGVMAFSGSAVLDSGNTSGFGRDGRPPLVAVYTGASGGKQAQYVAYSTNRGRTWTPHAGNPVLDIGSAEFRDPKVFWHAATQRWVMVVSLATLHRVRLYASPDLKRWTPLSEFGPAAATGGMWECPDLFELPVVDGGGHVQGARWVLVVNVNPGGIAGGSAAQYFLGRFDGTHFVADSLVPRTANPGAPGVRWADYGKDFYAAVSWFGAPAGDGRRVWIGWMNDWQYAGAIPTSSWRGAMSLPRTLALAAGPDGLRLVQQPAAELRTLRGPVRQLGPRSIAEGSTPLRAEGVSGNALEIDATFDVPADAAGAREFGLKVRTGRGEETTIGIDPRARQLVVDRTRSGRVGFHHDFPSRETAPLPVEHGRVQLRVFVDWSSVEVFAGGGRAVITDQIFPAPESDGVELYAVGGPARLVSLRAWPMRSAWTGGAARGGVGER